MRRCTLGDMSVAQEGVTGTDRWFANPYGRAWRCEAPSASVQGFHAALPGYAPTALVEAPALADELGVGRVLVKDESSRLGLSAFKVLGASWAVARVVAERAGFAGPLTVESLRAAVPRCRLTLVTATDGNHGRAVARMAALFGLPAHVLVPDVMSEQAAAAIAEDGAVVTRVVGDYDEVVRRAAADAGTGPDRALVQDVAWPGYEQVPGWIVEGYATLLLEVDAQLAERGLGAPDLVVVPVGVGSLAQAVLAHHRSRDTDRAAAVLSVEPDTADCVLASLRAGERRSVPTGATVMAGLNCGTPSSSAWPCLRDGLDGAVAVSDSDAFRAVVDLAELGLSSGPSGAATLAGARAALTGPGSDARRAGLGVDPRSVVVLLSTEGRPGPPTGATSAPTPAPCIEHSRRPHIGLRR